MFHDRHCPGEFPAESDSFHDAPDLGGRYQPLSSVVAGNVLRDMIDSGIFPVVHLVRIFRQRRPFGFLALAYLRLLLQGMPEKVARNPPRDTSG
jgi:hypothetical protein